MTDGSEPACPVDHRAREAWLAQARAASQPGGADGRCPVDDEAARPRTWTQTLASYLPWSGSWGGATSSPAAAAGGDGLGTDRVLSSIPRSAPAACPVEHGGAANHELESGADAASGHWVYPSEKMFFDAMRRKGHDARAADMKTVVPIHNAVNERAWEQIRQWEAPYLEHSQCGGPKLASFANKNDRMTPTARLNTILGYTAPFDRHDWVIDRCGTRVDYVIDFYAGRARGKPGPSFYLDVRPKLNTWEGVKMRAMRWAGMA
ncbi:hypothetical protein CDD83_10348 [Cordyceps sp. RAO-2017]|nr:hypothetical protein CDD83_10348 [Cordyceps sp. RAO-2017]